MKSKTSIVLGAGLPSPYPLPVREGILLVEDHKKLSLPIILPKPVPIQIEPNNRRNLRNQNKKKP